MEGWLLRIRRHRLYFASFSKQVLLNSSIVSNGGDHLIAKLLSFDLCLWEDDCNFEQELDFFRDSLPSEPACELLFWSSVAVDFLRLPSFAAISSEGIDMDFSSGFFDFFRDALPSEPAFELLFWSSVAVDFLRLPSFAALSNEGIDLDFRSGLFGSSRFCDRSSLSSVSKKPDSVLKNF
jgi:hypothetical protein